VVAQKIAAPRRTINPQQPDQLLIGKDGEILPALRGLSSTGKPFVDLAKEMLERQIAVFAADPKDPPVTHLAEVVIDTGSSVQIKPDDGHKKKLSSLWNT
jgi:hypothetical protein